MKNKTREMLDGISMLVVAMATPIGTWAMAGADTSPGPLIAAIVFSLIAGGTGTRLWLKKDPRVSAGIELPAVKIGGGA